MDSVTRLVARYGPGLLAPVLAHRAGGLWHLVDHAVGPGPGALLSPDPLSPWCEDCAVRVLARSRTAGAARGSLFRLAELAADLRRRSEGAGVEAATCLLFELEQVSREVSALPSSLLTPPLREDLDLLSSSEVGLRAPLSSPMGLEWLQERSGGLLPSPPRSSSPVLLSASWFPARSVEAKVLAAHSLRPGPVAVAVVPAHVAEYLARRRDLYGLRDLQFVPVAPGDSPEVLETAALLLSRDGSPSPSASLASVLEAARLLCAPDQL